LSEEIKEELAEMAEANIENSIPIEEEMSDIEETIAQEDAIALMELEVEQVKKTVVDFEIPSNPMLLSDAIGIIKANPGERQIRMGERII
jgi:hypothetical protein